MSGVSFWLWMMLRDSSSTASEVNAIAGKLLTEPVRYGKPGLQAHIMYLASLTSGVDQKIGRDAIDRYQVLRKELDAVKAEVDALLGPDRASATSEAAR